MIPNFNQAKVSYPIIPILNGSGDEIVFLVGGDSIQSTADSELLTRICRLVCTSTTFIWWSDHRAEKGREVYGFQEASVSRHLPPYRHWKNPVITCRDGFLTSNRYLWMESSWYALILVVPKTRQHLFRDLKK